MDTTLAANPGALTPAPLLRFALLVDGVTSGALGLLLLLAGTALAGPLGLPAGLLLGAALAVLPFAGFVGWLSRRAEAPAWWIKAVIGVNVAWVAASLLLLVSGQVAPSALGLAFILMQALAVEVFALLQWRGLRQSFA